MLRIGDRAQHDEQFAQFVLLRQACARRRNRHVPFGERARVTLDRLPGRAEDHEVPRRFLPRRHTLRDPARDHRGIHLHHLVPVSPARRPHDVCEYSVVRYRLMPSLHRPVGRLLRRGLGGKHAGEVSVHHGLHRAHRAEVRRERQHDTKRLHAPLHQLVDLDIGAPESEDALLRIAHHEQAAGPRRHPAPVVAFARVGGEKKAHLRLDRIGILELVHQQVRIARPQVVAHRGVLAQQLCREQQ